MRKFKQTALYFWLTVIFFSLRATVTSHDAKGKLVDTLVGILVAFALAVSGVFVLGLAGMLPVAGLNLWTPLLTLGAYLVIRFFGNLFYFPAKLYFDAKGQEIPLYWDDVDIRVKELRSGEIFRGYGIELKNKKSLPIEQVVLELPVLEIDGRSPGRVDVGKGYYLCRRLYWEKQNQYSATWHDVQGFGGTWNFRLVEFVGDTDNKRCQIKHQEPDQDIQRIESDNPMIEESAIHQMRGELRLVGRIKNQHMESNVYNFTVTNIAAKKPKIILRNGELK